MVVLACPVISFLNGLNFFLIGKVSIFGACVSNLIECLNTHLLR